MSGIFLIRDDNEDLIEMTEQQYDSEGLLQALLAKYPNLIAGDQIDSSAPREWLLVTREASLPGEQDGAGRWSVDHLFLDQDGIPTLVEIKRSTDTRLRREVVGQMLDYAANAVAYWSINEIRAKFEMNCNRQGMSAEQALEAYLNGRCDPETFWTKVKTNLEAGVVRMVFVADVIPAELQRIIEFLNIQMNPAEVLGLEIRQYSGEGVQTLVPRVIGQTAAARDRKSGGTRSQRQWDEESFLTELQTRKGADEARVARDILAWAKEGNLRIWWGKGNIDGSFYPMLDFGDQSHWTISVWTYGRVEIQFQEMKKKPPFDDESLRNNLLARLNEIPKIALPADSIGRRPSIPLSVLTESATMSGFLAAMDWYLDQIRVLRELTPAQYDSSVERGVPAP